MNVKLFGFAIFVAMTVSVPSRGAVITSETVETIPSRPGYTQTFIFSRVANPVASLIMYPGGKGYIGIFPNGSAQFDAFIVYRARKLFAEQGFNVAVLDAPSEWGSRGIWEQQRSPEYAAHNAATIAWLRQQANVPVFLLGFSAGAISATGVAAQLGDKGADGLILLSPWMPPKEKWPIPNFVFDSSNAIPSWSGLNRIRGPMLIVHHLEDSCYFSLPEYVPFLASALSAARKPDVIGLQGGASPSGNACYPGGRNNFNGLERDVADAVGNWVRRSVNMEIGKQ
jgi:pimeloyl-ACP methyl ester carboxylesterase